MSDKSLFSIETLDGESNIATEKEIFSITSLPFSPKNEVNLFYMETEEEQEAQMPIRFYASRSNGAAENHSPAVTEVAFTIEPNADFAIEEEEWMIPQMETPKEAVFSTDNYMQYEVYIAGDTEYENADNQIDDVSLEKEDTLELSENLFENEEVFAECEAEIIISDSLATETEYSGTDFSDLLAEDKTEILVETEENHGFDSNENIELLPEIPLVNEQALAQEEMELAVAEKAAAILREQQLEAKSFASTENTVHFQKKNRRFNIKVSEEELAKYFQSDKIQAEGQENTAVKGQVDSIIDKFLLEQPQMKRPNMNANFEDLLIEEEEVPETEIVTETMAKLHLLQGNKSEAINIYEKLCLVFPEKISYFAEQIQIINSKE